MNTYLITPGEGKPFELDAANAIDAMSAARERLGVGVTYRIQRTGAVRALPFGQLTRDGRVQL